jgi:hypothetical protein
MQFQSMREVTWHMFNVAGFLSWDTETSHVDLEKELKALTSQAPEGEEARNGKKAVTF